jgi:hypothetical protein
MIKRYLFLLLIFPSAPWASGAPPPGEDNGTGIDTIVVTSRRSDANVTGVLTGVESLDIERIRRMPAFLGEVDVIKAIQMMPGVQMTSEGGSGFSVRGGSPDQNLILLDNAAVYNPSHLMGFFSVFNNDFVRSAELYKGDIPLKYGGRLSSLLEVNTIEERPRRFSGTGGIGLISSRLMLEGPAGGKTSWHVGGRRSYADLFLKLASNKELRGSTLHFYDLNAKVNYRLSDRDMLLAGGYYGNDVFGMKDFGRVHYGNGAADILWRHIYNAGLLSRLSFNFSDYTFGMSSSVDGMSASWRSGIRDFGLRMDFEHRIGGTFDLDYGISSTLHSIEPGKVSLDGAPGLVKLSRTRAFEHSLYLSNEHSPGRRITLRYGARLSLFRNRTTYFAAEPRAGIVVRTGAHSSVKASYARGTQFMQLANNSASGSPLDVWFAAGRDIKPQRSHLVSAGYFHNLRDDMFALSAEVYYKDMRDVIDFRDGAELMLNDDLASEIRSGRGRSYGLELSASKEKGVLTGFVNYTLSRSERTVAAINGGRTYPAPFDKTHSLNLSLAWAVSPSWEVSLNWVRSTGNPTTYPVARFDVDGDVVNIYSARNAYRFPDYHRMDVSVTWRPRHKRDRRWKGSWNISVYNVYNKKNPWMVRFDQTDRINYSEMIYLFGIVPSLTYNFRF